MYYSGLMMWPRSVPPFCALNRYNELKSFFFVDFRFVSWFSYHLSNFQFKWSWEDWEEVLRLDPEHPKPKFVKETLLRCLRLSYHQRVADGVPESFQGLVPDQPEPVVKYKMPSGDQVWSLSHKNNRSWSDYCLFLRWVMGSLLWL